MARLPIIRSRAHFYYLKGRALGDSHFYVPGEIAWKIMTRELSILQKEFDLEIACFVLLKNDFHLLLRSPSEPIDRVMFFFMMRVTLKIQRSSKRINHIFGGKYRGCLLQDVDLRIIRKYLFQLPVQSRQAASLEDFYFSTLNQRTSFIQSQLPTDNERCWIAKKFSEIESASIEWGMTKSIFKYRRDRNGRRNFIVPLPFPN